MNSTQKNAEPKIYGITTEDIETIRGVFRAAIQDFFEDEEPHQDWSARTDGATDLQYLTDVFLGIMREDHGVEGIYRVDQAREFASDINDLPACMYPVRRGPMTLMMIRDYLEEIHPTHP